MGQMTRGQWRAGWRAAEHERAIREALHLGDPYEALARAGGAEQSEVKKRSRRNPRAAALIAVRLSAAHLVTANGIHALTVAGPRGDLTPDDLIAVFGRALADAMQEGDHHGPAV